MTETTERKKEANTEDSAAAKIEAYLQGPRKKRKNYVILALGEGFDKDVSLAIEGYVKKNHPHLAISTPKTPDELTRQFGRNISLLVINDHFTDQRHVMKMVRSLKEKRRDEVIPVLFLTKDGENLVELYHEELFLYHESDEYIVYPNLPRQQLLSRVKGGVENQNKRKSRRYPVNLDVSFFHLTKDQMLAGHIVDISLHGGILSADDNQTIFRVGDQIKISIPVSEHLHTGLTGDFIRISGKIRRVFISGNRAGFSFEHVTPEQSKSIGQLILSLVDRYFQRQTNKLKAQPSNKPGFQR